MNVVITGSGGLIGSALLAALQNKHTLFAVGRSRPSNSEVNFIKLDLSSDWSITALPGKADAIFHLAQSEHFREFPQRTADVFEVNTVSTVKLLDYALKSGVKKFIYASSGGIYGFGDHGFSEEQEVVAHGDLGFYLGTKLCSEILVENYSKFFDVIIARFFFVYGKQQKRSMLIPRLVDNVRSGKEITLQGEEGIKTNPIHVSDAARAMVRCLDVNGSHKINIAGPEVLSLKQICGIIGKKVGKQPVIKYQENSIANHLVADVRKMNKMLGGPVVPFEKGVEDLL
ncbi:MAG: NAD(P)-dependent oxidoreductase [Bacteroidota bacterium]